MKTNDPIMIEALRRFGDMMRERRQQSEWSFLRMAEKLDIEISPATISAVENGEAWPSAAEREAISYFLGYGVDAFDKILRRLQIENAPNVVSLLGSRNKDGERLPHTRA